MAGFCVNLAKETARTASSRTRPQIVEVMLASTKAFVLAWVWQGHKLLRCVVVLKKADLFSHHILLHAGI